MARNVPNAKRSELLAALFRLPLVQLKADQVMWKEAQINDAGRRFLVWMHEIRHRGTFSKIAVAFTEVVDAVKGVEALKPLCHSWLQVRALSGPERQLTDRMSSLSSPRTRSRQLGGRRRCRTRSLLSWRMTWLSWIKLSRRSTSSQEWTTPHPAMSQRCTPSTFSKSCSSTRGSRSYSTDTLSEL